MARFFHPKAPLEAKYGKLDKKHLTGVIIIGKANHRVCRQFWMCYKCCIPDIHDHHKFVIICMNFNVTKAPANPFKDEVAPMHTPGTEEDPDRASNINENNIFTLNRGATSDDIAELSVQGIEVDNEDPALENTVAGVSAATRTWEELRTCPRRGDPNVTNTKGRFVAKPWTTVGEMDELALFRMCFPESLFCEVILPATNDHIQGDTVNLSKFYV
jgi:hypothetical protein